MIGWLQIVLLNLCYVSRDEILGHQFDQQTRVFSLCCSQSLLLADFKENPSLLWFLKSFKKSIHEWNLVERINEGGKPNNNSSLRRLEVMPRETSTKNPV
jgi:hypothetical protein